MIITDTKAGLVEWGIGLIWSHTPSWAKKVLIGTASAGASAVAGLTIFEKVDPGIIPTEVNSWIAVIAFILCIACHCFGIKCPIDQHGNIVNLPADMTQKGAIKCQPTQDTAGVDLSVKKLESTNN